MRRGTLRYRIAVRAIEQHGARVACAGQPARGQLEQVGMLVGQLGVAQGAALPHGSGPEESPDRGQGGEFGPRLGRFADIMTIGPQAGGRCGIRGSIGARSSALMLVASRDVRTPLRLSRPGSRPSRRTNSSPLGAPGVCAGSSDLESCHPIFSAPFRPGWAQSVCRTTRAWPSGVVKGSSTAPSTCRAIASGAWVRIACSIVCFMVTAEDGQPWQLTLQTKPDDPVGQAE